MMVKDATSKKLQVDFHLVEHHQRAIHERLVNWARWAIPREGSRVAPMWRLYRPPPQWEPRAYRAPCDVLDAARMEAMVRRLPHKHRAAVRWMYVRRCEPAVIARELGLSYESLYTHTRDGRQMLMHW